MKYIRELMVGRRGEAPLVPPYILCNFKLHGAVWQATTNELAKPTGYPVETDRVRIRLAERTDSLRLSGNP